ncbi:hypothetical protein BDQ17DRAFT_1356283 [Cyathus striatus]|nr:hypothetical protein BDQ17DRAFT_1356283 [Cyathus striatus]
MFAAHTFLSIFLGITLLTPGNIATVVDVPLAQGTQQICTVPPPSSVPFDTCINDLSNSGYTLQCFLGLTVNPATAQVGLQCQRITGAYYYWNINCNTQILCCQNDDYNGVITIGCFPVSQY